MSSGTPVRRGRTLFLAAFASWLILALGGISAALAEAELWFHKMVREGNASMLLSPQDSTAILIDGGRVSGGVSELEIDGEPLLRGLYLRGIRHLVILCSHPHADHVEGLRRLVTHRAEGPAGIDLRRFESVLLVDSAYPSDKSLRSASLAAHGEVASIRHAEATRVDVAGLLKGRLQSGELSFGSLPYEPGQKAAIHGHSIITQARLRKGDRALVYLDPDDASDAAINEALSRRGPLPKGTPLLLSAPHHGSRHSDLSIFEKLGWAPSAIVFQANAKSRFGHPHPDAWLRAVEMVGVNRVFVTGASELPMRVFDGTMPEPLSRPEVERTVSVVLDPRFDQINDKLSELRLRQAPLALSEPEQLQRQRRTAGVTQQKLADALGVPRGEIQQWESATVPAPRQADVARALDAFRTEKEKDRLTERLDSLALLRASYSDYLSRFPNRQGALPADPKSCRSILGNLIY